jgi:hypothetical protein
MYVELGIYATGSYAAASQGQYRRHCDFGIAHRNVVACFRP